VKKNFKKYARARVIFHVLAGIFGMPSAIAGVIIHIKFYFSRFRELEF